MNQDVIVEPYDYYCEDRTYHSIYNANLTCEFNGSTMKCAKFADVLWTIDGDVPGLFWLITYSEEPVVVCLSILHNFCTEVKT